MAGTTVTARHVATDTPYKINTNDLGQYRFTTVPPGNYEVTTESTGAPGTAINVVKVVAGASVAANFDPATPLATKKELAAGKPVKPIRFEVGGRLGWTFSDDVSLGRVEADDGNVYERLDPMDALSWGFTFGYFLTPRLELEFLYDRQSTTLQASGIRVVDVGDLTISNYHGMVAYHFGPPTSPLRLYAIGGLGATAYGTLAFTTAAGESREIGGGNKWSSTMGGGVKI